MTEYLLMFFVAFISATLPPPSRKRCLRRSWPKASHSPWLLVATAAAGNTLGAAVNWLLGLFAQRLRNKRWFPVKESALLARRQAWYHKYGRWSLLMSWLPLVGDALTVAAGVLREPFRSFLPITFSTGKLLRYVVLVGMYLMVCE